MARLAAIILASLFLCSCGGTPRGIAKLFVPGPDAELSQDPEINRKLVIPPGPVAEMGEITGVELSKEEMEDYLSTHVQNQYGIYVLVEERPAEFDRLFQRAVEEAQGSPHAPIITKKWRIDQENSGHYRVQEGD